MLGNISYQRKIVNYFLKHTEKIKKRGFCSRVRFGESMLDDKFIQRGKGLN